MTVPAIEAIVTIRLGEGARDEALDQITSWITGTQRGPAISLQTKNFPARRDARPMKPGISK